MLAALLEQGFGRATVFVCAILHHQRKHRLRRQLSHLDLVALNGISVAAITLQAPSVVGLVSIAITRMNGIPSALKVLIHRQSRRQSQAPQLLIQLQSPPQRQVHRQAIDLVLAVVRKVLFGMVASASSSVTTTFAIRTLETPIRTSLQVEVIALEGVGVELVLVSHRNIHFLQRMAGPYR
jgi:translation initiation factor 2 alpha subunit (eIF-2alpha)